MNKSKIIILGSGGLRIGQAGEFDYSGSQSIKALKEEGVFTILVNPNIATVQTDADMADRLYLQPLNLATVSKIIDKEQPDGILLSVGGQTALNLGLELERAGILKKYGVKVLGTSTDVIRITEDREEFKEALSQIGIKSPRSIAATTPEEALIAAKTIGFPVMLRAGFSLGGLGSGCFQNEKDLYKRAAEVLNSVPQILIEEYLTGWKELEYEIVRDAYNNTIVVCNMENLDPMGIHTGESIVVAPSQTLTNSEYHLLREIAIKVACHLGIVGECNIQYALNPKNGDYRVIELNARLSRSSALASKATGYPLAYVATKLALGKRLNEIKNQVTKKTTAFFEPALDYLVVKIPRWDTAKIKYADRGIGSEMKSVGEVMGIGRSFPEALQKAIRMLNIGANGLTDYPYLIQNTMQEIQQPTDRRLFALYQFFQEGGSVDEVHQMSHIDKWFLHHLKRISDFEKEIVNSELTHDLLMNAKKMGFSDRQIGKLTHTLEETVRQKRISYGLTPCIKQIDTLAGEFDAETNYLYMTYHGHENDVEPAIQPPVTIIGAGPYCIGSSVEFDWCAVNTAKTLRQLGEVTIVINSNPETVSTDFDTSDRLYFEELSLERVRDIADFEKPKGIVVSVGGQIANNLAIPLHKNGYPILGTSPLAIDKAENRHEFSNLLHQLEVDQPPWQEAGTYEKAKEFCEDVGYPVLIRPSYVLSGAAMNVIFDEVGLQKFLNEAKEISPDHPVVISKFIDNAKELEIDGVAENGTVVIQAILEHIENAGIHSGDATLVLPPQRLTIETIRRAKIITRKIVKSLGLHGPFNIQFLAVDNAIKVIECNVRASRSFPFVSKVTNHNFIEIATQVMLGVYKPAHYETLELDFVGVKSPQFSYHRLKGSNPVAHVEMASTGEVACLGDSLLEAFLMSWMATEQQVRGKRILVSVGDEKKIKLLQPLQILYEQGWEIYATEHTHDFLAKKGIKSHFIYKGSQQNEPNALTLIEKKNIDLIVNIPRSSPTGTHLSDGYVIRRLAIDHHIPLVTNLQLAHLFLHCLSEINPEQITIKSWNDYVNINQ